MIDYETIGRVAQALSNARNAYQSGENEMAREDLRYALEQIEPKLALINELIEAQRAEKKAEQERIQQARREENEKFMAEHFKIIVSA